MKYESLTNSQKSIFDRLEKEIKDYIAVLENKIAAISEIEYYPKKDGTEKANFSLNFGLKNFGVSYTAKRWGKTENIHPVDVWLDYGYGFKNSPVGVKFRISPVFDYEKREYLSNFKYVDVENIYFSFKEVKNFLGLDESEEFKNPTAKKVFELITVYYKNELYERLKNYKEELEKLPFFFEKAIKISNYLMNEVNKTSEFTFIHSFYYQNFENKDVYCLSDKNR